MNHRVERIGKVAVFPRGVVRGPGADVRQVCAALVRRLRRLFPAELVNLLLICLSAPAAAFLLSQALGVDPQTTAMALTIG